MPALSTLPTIEGLSLPEGTTNVKFKNTAADTTSQKIDVTTLSDTQRVYAAPPLIDVGGGASGGVTNQVVVSFFGIGPAVNTDPEASGWVCIERETEYAVGDVTKGTATYVYKEPPAE